MAERYQSQDMYNRHSRVPVHTPLVGQSSRYGILERGVGPMAGSIPVNFNLFYLRKRA